MTDSDSDSDSGSGESHDYTELQETLIAFLSTPRSAKDLAEEVYAAADSAAVSNIRSLVKRVNDSHEGTRPIKYDSDAGCYYWDGDDEVLHQMSTRAKQTKTRHANRKRAKMEREIKLTLKALDPPVTAQEPEPSNEDVVFPLADLHYGDEISHPETGETLYNFDIADENVERIVSEGLAHIQRARSHTDFDTCHLVLLGDIATGETVYNAQWVDIEGTLDEQTERARDALWGAIDRLAREFSTLQVAAVPGNHGDRRASAASGQANTDIQVYGELDAMARVSDHDNINFVRNKETTHFVNFPVRGGKLKAHARHGENASDHVDATARSESDWRGWLHIHDFDFALKAHIHQDQKEMAMDVPVFTGGSPRPPDEFAEQMAKWGAPATTIFGVSDDAVPTWQRSVHL